MVGVGGRDESAVVFGIGLEEDGDSDATVPEGRGEVDLEARLLNKDLARVKSLDKHPALDFGELLGMDMGIFERRKRKTAH